MANNFYSFIDNDPHHPHRSKSDNIRIKINDEADKVIKQLTKNQGYCVWLFSVIVL